MVCIYKSVFKMLFVLSYHNAYNRSLHVDTLPMKVISLFKMRCHDAIMLQS